MVKDSNNTDEQDAVTAEALYAQYRRNRVSAVTKFQDKAASVESLSTTELTAESVFERYREQRNSPEEQTIDSLVQLIHQHADFNGDVAMEQQSVSSYGEPGVAPKIEPVVQGTSHVGDTVHQAPAANERSLFKRLVLPAIAAAVLGIALIPVMLNQTTQPDIQHASLPALLADDLVQNAAASVAYLEPPIVGAFGFSDSASEPKQFFSYGVAMTEVELMVRAGKHADAIRYVQKIDGQQLETQARTSNAEDVIDANTITSAKVELITALKEGGTQIELEEKFNDLRSSVERNVPGNNVGWYNTGRAVESLRIAAAYSLDQSETQSMEQAIQLASAVDFPQDVNAVVKPLNTLAQITLSAPDEFEQISQILNTTENIKALMQ